MLHLTMFVYSYLHPQNPGDVQNIPKPTQEQQALPTIPGSCLFPGRIHTTEPSNTKKKAFHNLRINSLNYRRIFFKAPSNPNHSRILGFYFTFTYVQIYLFVPQKFLLLNSGLLLLCLFVLHS